MYKKIILICGMPRSGTSWLGQILDSSPDVAFRMEPLFAYKFKNIINEESGREDIVNYFNEVYLTSDDFIHQKNSRANGLYSTFEKNILPKYLVVKTTRHHHLLENYLKLIDCIEIISIVRHPCAVISSWINTDREFQKKGCEIERDWRSGECRKGEVGEFWGFDDWLSVTKNHMKLKENYHNFNIIKYSDLIQKPEHIIYQLFERLSIPCTEQTTKFIKDCHDNNDNDPYSVFKNKDVENKWKSNLNKEISEIIVDETILSDLREFVT